MRAYEPACKKLTCTSPPETETSVTDEIAFGDGDDDGGEVKRREGKTTDGANGTGARLSASGRIASTVSDVEAIACHTCRGLDGVGQMLPDASRSHLRSLDQLPTKASSKPWLCPTCQRETKPSPAALPSTEATWPLQADGRTPSPQDDSRAQERTEVVAGEREKDARLSARTKRVEFERMASVRLVTPAASLDGGEAREVGQRASTTATGTGAPESRGVGGVTQGGSIEPSPRVRSPRDARQTGSAGRRALAAIGADGGRETPGGLPPSNPGNDDGRRADSPSSHAESPRRQTIFSTSRLGWAKWVGAGPGGGKDGMDEVVMPRVSPGQASDPAHQSPKQDAMECDRSRSEAKTRSVVLEDLPRLDSVVPSDACLPPYLVSSHRAAGVATGGTSANPAAANLEAYSFRQTERSRYSPHTRVYGYTCTHKHSCVRACVRACACAEMLSHSVLTCMLFAAGGCHSLCFLGPQKPPRQR